MLFVLVVVLALVFADWLAGAVAVQHCDSANEDDDGNSPDVSAVVLSDVHIDSLCPFADIWMRRIRQLAANRWRATHVLVLGDIFSTVGGDVGKWNVSDTTYAFHVARAKLVAGCNDLVCVWIPGNHDLQTGKYQHRYVEAFGWPGRFGNFGNTGNWTYYLHNSMDPSLVPTPSARADVFLTHIPMNRAQPADIARAITIVGPRLVLAGHTHTAARDTLVHDNAVIEQVTIPALNFLRAVESGDGNMGLGWLRIYRDGRLSVEFCRPLNRRSILILWTVFAVLGGMAVTYWWWLARVRDSTESIDTYVVAMMFLEYTGWMLVHLSVLFIGLLVAEPLLTMGLWLAILLVFRWFVYYHDMHCCVTKSYFTATRKSSLKWHTLY